MIMDTHMHTWRYPEHFNREVMISNQPPRRRGWSDEKFKQMWDNPIERYFKEVEGMVDKAIMQSLRSGNTFGITTPNAYLARLKQEYPHKLEWCCGLDPLDAEAPKELERCVKELGAIGVGEYAPAYQGVNFNDERCFPVYEKAQELRVPIVTHAGPGQPHNLRMSYANILNIDDVAIRFPELRIVICHMGYYKYEDAVHLVQKHDNVFADVSWLVTLAGLDKTSTPRYLPVVEFPYFHLLYPLLYYFSQTFGPTDKLIWGSDWTGSSPKQSLDILLNVNKWLKKYNLPEIAQESLNNIVYENWKKVYPNLAA